MLFLCRKVIQVIFWVIKSERFLGWEKSYFKFFMQNQVIFRPIIISALIVAILYKVKKKKIQKIIVISKLQFFSAKLNMRL